MDPWFDLTNRFLIHKPPKSPYLIRKSIYFARRAAPIDDRSRAGFASLHCQNFDQKRNLRALWENWAIHYRTRPAIPKMADLYAMEEDDRHHFPKVTDDDKADHLQKLLRSRFGEHCA